MRPQFPTSASAEDRRLIEERVKQAQRRGVVTKLGRVLAEYGRFPVGNTHDPTLTNVAILGKGIHVKETGSANHWFHTIAVSCFPLEEESNEVQYWNPDARIVFDYRRDEGEETLYAYNPGSWEEIIDQAIADIPTKREASAAREAERVRRWITDRWGI